MIHSKAREAHRKDLCFHPSRSGGGIGSFDSVQKNQTRISGLFVTGLKDHIALSDFVSLRKVRSVHIIRLIRSHFRALGARNEDPVA